MITDSNKVDLLKQFYSTMRTDIVKLEVKNIGFHFIDLIERTGARLEYGELKGDIPKYKISNIHPNLLDFMFKLHVEQESNICMYYNENVNTVLSFNLDDKDKSGDEIISELKAAVLIIRGYLNIFDIEPLVYVSGRGYHIVIRIDKPIDNKKLYKFAWLVKWKNEIIFKGIGLNFNKINITTYPISEGNDRCSLRLFGSQHVKNKVFSNVLSHGGDILNEIESWRYFENYMHTKTITSEHFKQVCESHCFGI